MFDKYVISRKLKLIQKKFSIFVTSRDDSTKMKNFISETRHYFRCYWFPIHFLNIIPFYLSKIFHRFLVLKTLSYSYLHFIIDGNSEMKFQDQLVYYETSGISYRNTSNPYSKSWNCANFHQVFTDKKFKKMRTDESKWFIPFRF